MSGKLWAGPVEEPDRYKLWAVVGGGGEGKVHRGTRALPDGDIDVAVKEVLPDRLQQRGLQVDQVAEQWAAQAARLRNLGHPGLVGVQEAFVGAPPHPRGVHAEGRQAYFVMAWVDGPDYATWLADRRGDRLAVLENVADALDALHRAGQVHADVKPGNVLVQAETLPTGATHESGVLVDFGLMRAITGTPPSDVGFTAGYAAPELRRGVPYSPASDLYGLAGLVLLALTGQHPSDGPDAAREARKRLAGSPVPKATVDAVVGALDPDPARRPTGGCRTWLATARGGLTSTVRWPTAAMGGHAAGGDGNGAAGAPDGPKRRLPRVAATIALSITVTVTVAVVRNYTFADGSEGSATTTTEQVTTTSTTERPTTTTSTTSPSTTRQLGGDVNPDDNLLASLQPIDETWVNDTDLKIDGIPYLNGLRSQHITSCWTDAVRQVEYSIDRRYTTLRTVVGLSDESASGLPMEVEITGDGTPLWTGTVQVGQPEELALDVTGVLRLRVTATRQFDRTSECNSVYAALGDPVLE